MELSLDDKDDCDVAGGCCIGTDWFGTDWFAPVLVGVKEGGRLETEGMVWGPISETVSKEEKEL